MGFLNFLQGVGRQVNPFDNNKTFSNPQGNPKQGTDTGSHVFNFLSHVANPVVGFGQSLATAVGHTAQIPFDIAKTIPAAITDNPIAAKNASNQANTNIQGLIQLGQSVPRGIISLRQSAANLIDPNNPTTGNVTLPSNPITGNTPIPTLQSQFATVKQQSGSTAQAVSSTALSFLGDVAGAKVLGEGALKAGEGAATGAKAVTANTTPLTEIGSIGKDVNPATDIRIPIAGVGTLRIGANAFADLTKATTSAEVKNVIGDSLPQAIVSKIAPAIANTKDPNIISNILSKSLTPKTPSLPPDVSPALTPTPISDVTVPGEGSTLPTPEATPVSPPPTTPTAVAESTKPPLAPEIQQAVDRATKPVDTGTFNYDPNAKNFKGTAGEIRQAYSGEKNAQQQAASVLTDTLKKAAPDEQSAIYWYRDQGGSIDNLQKLLDNPDPKLDPYRQDIQKAMNLSPAAKQVSSALDQVYERAGANAVDQGTLKNVLNDYGNTRLYKEDQPIGIGATLKQTTGAAKSRIYPTVADAVLNGKELTTTNASDVAAVHIADLARVNTTRNLLDNVGKSGLGKWTSIDNMPEGWTQVGKTQKSGAFVDSSGVAHSASKVFAAPADLAKRLGAITDPNLLNKVDGVKKIAAYQGLVKTVDLSLSLFHAITFVAQALTNTKFGWDVLKNGTEFMNKINSPEFANNENLFVKAGGMTTKAGELQDITRNLATTGTKSILGKVQDFPVAKQFLQLTDHVTSALFDKGQRWLKVTDYTNKFENYASKHPDTTPAELTKVSRDYARQVNATYGGLNWEAMGISKTQLGVLRFALLAPDWVISNISLGKYAISERGVAGQASRAQLFNALTTGMVSTQVMNKAITGHYTNENPKGHEFDVQIAPNVYITLFRGGPGEVVKAFQDIQNKGLAQGIGGYLQGKASPLARTAIGISSGTQFTGQPINKPNSSFFGKLGDQAKYTALSAGPIPFGISGAVKYANNARTTKQPINPLITASLATGVSRFSKTNNNLSTREQAVLSQLTKQGAGKQEINAVTSFYLTAKAGASGRGKVSSAIDAALAKGDQNKAQQLASDYNKKYAQAFKGWIQKYGTYSNPGLEKAYNSHKINLSDSAIQSRLNSIKSNPLYSATTGGN